MLRMIAILFGIAFIFAGVAGFMDIFMKDGMLFGFFMVDTLHNMVHIITGVIAIMAATSFQFTKLFFMVFGIIYTIVAIWGFWTGGDLMIMQVNEPDNMLHLVVGVLAIYLGFSANARA